MSSSPSIISRSLATLDGMRRLAVSWLKNNPAGVMLGLALFGVLVWFYAFQGEYKKTHDVTAFAWIRSNWDEKHGYDHGFLGPLLMIVLACLRMPEVDRTPRKPSYWGLAMCVFGLLLYLVAIRSIQPRIAWGALPFILVGGVGWLHSLRAARLLAFPFFIIYFVIPVPGLLQATNKLQIFSSFAAHWLATHLGVDAIRTGTNIVMKNALGAEGGSFDVAEGCSGMRSLMALTLISAVYAHLTQKTFWKKVVLFACSLPLAILGNCLRLTSVFVVARFNYEFAKNQIHDGAGFIFFLVIGLAGLMTVDSLLNRTPKEKIVTRKVVRSTGSPTPEPTATTES